MLCPVHVSFPPFLPRTYYRFFQKGPQIIGASSGDCARPPLFCSLRNHAYQKKLACAGAAGVGNQLEQTDRGIVLADGA
jgi:hypothetical protein